MYWQPWALGIRHAGAPWCSGMAGRSVAFDARQTAIIVGMAASRPWDLERQSEAQQSTAWRYVARQHV